MGVVVRYLKEHPKTGELIYRRAIPAELRAFADRTQVRRFLGAKSSEGREASRSLTEAREEYEEVVRRAQHRAEAERRTSNGTLQPITPALSEFLVQASKVEALDDDEWARWQPKSPDRRREKAKRLQENVEEDLTERDPAAVEALYGSFLEAERRRQARAASVDRTALHGVKVGAVNWEAPEPDGQELKGYDRNPDGSLYPVYGPPDDADIVPDHGEQPGN